MGRGTSGRIRRRGPGGGPRAFVRPRPGAEGGPGSRARPPEPPLLGARNPLLDGEVVASGWGKPRSTRHVPLPIAPLLAPLSPVRPLSSRSAVRPSSTPSSSCPSPFSYLAPFHPFPLLQEPPSRTFSDTRPRPAPPHSPPSVRGTQSLLPQVSWPRSARLSRGFPAPRARLAAEAPRRAAGLVPGVWGSRVSARRVLPLASSRGAPRSWVSQTSRIPGVPVGTKYRARNPPPPAPQRPNPVPWTRVAGARNAAQLAGASRCADATLLRDFHNLFRQACVVGAAYSSASYSCPSDAKNSFHFSWPSPVLLAPPQSLQKL